MSQTALKDRIRIFNRSGSEIASFRASVSRSWAIGREGRASLEYPSRKTDVVNDTVLRFGNYILVENSRLPAWVGIIDTPREWTKDTVTVNAYTFERLFKYRIGGRDETLTGSAGAIFRQIVNYINLQEKTILEVGSLLGGNIGRQETLTPITLENNLRQLWERSGEDYEFIPQIVKGKLTVRGNWVQSLGVETPMTLLEGGNIESASMNEDGTITNSVFGYGDGINWKSRPNLTTPNITSIEYYGLRQNSKEWSGVSVIGTIENNNNEYLSESVTPRKIFEVTALNVGETFDYLSLGNRVNIQLNNMGFYRDGQGTIERTRILGMSYDPRQGQKVKLVLRDG